MEDIRYFYCFTPSDREEIRSFDKNTTNRSSNYLQSFHIDTNIYESLETTHICRHYCTRFVDMDKSVSHKCDLQTQLDKCIDNRRLRSCCLLDTSHCLSTLRADRKIGCNCLYFPNIELYLSL